MNILIYCPDSLTREAIARHLIEMGDFQLLFAESERLVVSLTMFNPIHLLILFNPEATSSLCDLKEFLRQKRPRMRIRLLPSRHGVLMQGWRQTISGALRPVKKRKEKPFRTHPRFSWKPTD